MTIEVDSLTIPKSSIDQQAELFENDGMTFRELFAVLWKGKWLILLVTAIFSLTSAFYSLTLESIYRMETTLTSAGARTSGSALAGQLGGAAALIGIDLGSATGEDRIPNALTVLQSRRFITNFVKGNDFVVALFAGIWDPETGTSSVDPQIYNQETGQWLRGTGLPTDLEIYRAFSSLLNIDRDRSSGVITISINWRDPVVGTEWLNRLVQEINNQLKGADQAEANNAISFLRAQLQSTQLVEMQRVFYELIESQIRVTMLADVREEYIFQVIDPAVVPDERISPRRSVIVIVGSFAGGILAVLLLLLRHMYFLRRVS
jgi:uncharacterized protein involved in exopolysaccharide biosynthesis